MKRAKQSALQGVIVRPSSFAFASGINRLGTPDVNRSFENYRVTSFVRRYADTPAGARKKGRDRLAEIGAWLRF
jgi:hypothetical protein